MSLRSRNSAAYKGLHALLLRDGGQDFRIGDTIDVQQYFDDAIDIHHIFPKSWCKGQRLERGRYDSIVNKTPLSAKTNRMIGGSAPSEYLPKLQKVASIDAVRMDALLATHVIDASTLRTDSFDKFFAARERALLDRIEKAMGKPIAGTATTNPAPEPDLSEDEDE